MPRKIVLWVAIPAALAITMGVVWRSTSPPPPAPASDAHAFVRRMLWFELQPVRLPTCELQRFGEPHDGGYLLCGNLLGAVQAGYSYGISGYDGWGCDVSTRLQVPVHQYDCFNPTRPACGGQTTFHDECVGAATDTREGRRFDTMARQLAANGDADRHVVVKMDVEGAEWESFLDAPAEVLERIDQLVVEFHGTDDRRFVVAVRRLKQWFHVANFHLNNHSCEPGRAPFPAWAYEVLFVSKRLAEAVPGERLVPGSQPLDVRNDPTKPDCQALPVAP